MSETIYRTHAKLFPQDRLVYVRAPIGEGRYFSRSTGVVSKQEGELQKASHEGCVVLRDAAFGHSLDEETFILSLWFGRSSRAAPMKPRILRNTKSVCRSKSHQTAAANKIASAPIPRERTKDPGVGTPRAGPKPAKAMKVRSGKWVRYNE